MLAGFGLLAGFGFELLPALELLDGVLDDWPAENPLLFDAFELELLPQPATTAPARASTAAPAARRCV